MTRSTTDEAAAEPLPSPKERRRLREAKSLSEDQVAAAVGVTRATVRSWETGRTSPRGRKRALYAKVLAAETKPGAKPEASPGAGPGPGVESVTEPTATELTVELAAVKPAAVKPTTVKPAAVKPAAVVAVATEPVVEPGADSADARPAAKPAGRAAGKASTKAAVRPAPHPVTRPESVTTGAEPERGLPAPPPPRGAGLLSRRRVRRALRPDRPRPRPADVPADRPPRPGPRIRGTRLPTGLAPLARGRRRPRPGNLGAGRRVRVRDVALASDAPHAPAPRRPAHGTGQAGAVRRAARPAPGLPAHPAPVRRGRPGPSGDRRRDGGQHSGGRGG